MTKAKKIGLFIYVFFLFFGPKIGMYIDTSIIASVIVISISAVKNNHRIRIPKYTRSLILSILIILFYTALVSVFNRYFDIVFFGRMIRSVFSLVGISALFLDNSDTDVDEMNEIIIGVLLIHAAVVLISSTVYINLQYLLRPFNGYEKTIRMFRSTGLMMGFDMSGLLCNLGLVLVMCKKKLNILQFALFVTATLFTSRFSILFLVVVTVGYVIVNFRNYRARGKLFLLLGIGIPVAIFGIILLIVTTGSLYNSQSNLLDKFPLLSKLVLLVNKAYNVNDNLILSESKHFTISDDPFLATFGTGVYDGADPGYTRFINCIGIAGLISVIIWHLYAIWRSIDRKLTDKRYKYNRAFILLTIIMVLVGLNIKNCYFFTGTFFEFMILQLFMFRFCKQYRFSVPGEQEVNPK